MFLFVTQSFPTPVIHYPNRSPKRIHRIMRQQVYIMIYYSFYSAYFASRTAAQPLVMLPEVTARHHLLQDVTPLHLIRLDLKEKVIVNVIVIVTGKDGLLYPHYTFREAHHAELFD